MSLEGRLGIKKDGEIKKRAPERDPVILIEVKSRHDDVAAQAEIIFKSLAKEVHKHPLWDAFLNPVLGCGEAIAAVIISEFDIEKFENISKGWQFAGMNPGMVHGKIKKGDKIIVTDTMIRGDKKTKGFLCPYNQFLKMVLLGRLGPSFLKCNSPYRQYYDNMKHRYESEDWGTLSKHPTDPKRPKAGHQHNAANRYMVKRFIVDLYVAWRTLEGLPVREPYQQEYLGKNHAA
jgi:hypothetical protein